MGPAVRASVSGLGTWSRRLLLSLMFSPLCSLMLSPRRRTQRCLSRCLLLTILSYAGAASQTALAADAPIWSQRRHHPSASADSVRLTGVDLGSAFRPEDATLLPQSEAAADARMLPLADNLLDLGQWRPFGRDDRVRVQTQGHRTVVACSAGPAPAGVVLSWPGWRLPRGMRGALVLRLHGGRDFAWAMVSTGQDVTEPNGRIASDAVARLTIAATHWAAPGDHELVLLCPRHSAALEIASIRLEPATAAAAEASARPTGTWLWRITDWLDRPERLIDRLRRAGVTSVFIQFELTGDQLKDPVRSRQLLARLRAEGIAAHAVEGDPAMTSVAGRAHARDRARVLRGLFDGAHPGRSDAPARSGGAGIGAMQVDIEPYLNPDFARDPAGQWQAWAASIRALSGELDRPVEVVVPFWLFDSPGASAALDSVIGSISRVVVMAYRTDASEVEAMAERWLHWGAQQGRPVAIALEAGPLPDDIQRTYTRAAEGPLTVRFSGPIAEVELYPRNVRPADGAAAFRPVGEVRLPATRLTFADNPQALRAVRQRLERHLSAWPAFDGLLLHEVVRR